MLINIIYDSSNKMFSTTLNERVAKAHPLNDALTLSQAKSRDPKLMKKIVNFRIDNFTEDERQIYTVDILLDKIITDPLFRTMFRQKPGRQSIHENTQIECIQQKYPDAFKMNSNIGGTCFTNYNLHKISKECPRTSSSTKTFDLYIPSQKRYGVLKYTKTSGGAQDNQCNDVKQFIYQAVGYLNEKTKSKRTFIFYLDGDYYTEKKITELNQMIPEHFKEKIIITNCESI
jgi:hypothetical protein